MPPRKEASRRRRPQISLGWLVAGVLLLGPLLGFGGQLAFRIIQDLRQPRPQPAAKIPAHAFDAPPVDYYESGETPLN